MFAAITVADTPPLKVRPLAVAVLLFAFAASVPIRLRMDRETERRGQYNEALYVTSGETLNRLSLGYGGLLADIYWTRAVQYFGRERLAGHTRFDLLGQLLRVTTTLDPHLLIAYRFGAIFLAEKPPAGAGRPEEALALIRRGIVANPSYWRLWEDLGFIYYWDLKDYAHAARAFQAGSEQPGAEVWMKTLAASVAASGGEMETSRLLWAQVYRQAGNAGIRQSALEHLAALQAAEEIRQLNQAFAAFERREGRQAGSFRELIQAGLIRRQPIDPTGVPYVIGRDGSAALGPGSKIDLSLAQ